MIDNRFGTPRGLARLIVDNARHRLGLMRDCTAFDWADVKRVVFVCHGNICRSAFAEAVARRHGMPVASFGLAATTGTSPPAPSLEAAWALGYDMSAHRATSMSDHAIKPGDLLVAMEYRQVRRLAEQGMSGPKTLFGIWRRPSTPHIHDPFTLSDAYFRTCFTRIEETVAELAGRVRGSPGPVA